MTLEPIEPEEAVEWYLEEKRTDSTNATVQSHGYRLKHFIRWCGERDIDNLNELSGRDMARYKTWRRGEGINHVTLKTQLDTIRVFIRFCERIDGVEERLSEAIVSPSLTSSDAKDEMVNGDEAEAIREHLQKYEYAEVYHVYALLLSTGIRMGACRAIDVGDVDLDDRSISLHHRPESDTPLKNGKDGERVIAIPQETVTTITDYLADKRVDIEDVHGRKPLLATSYGRPGRQTVRKWSYRITRPCAYGQECPHDKDPEDCRAARSGTQWGHECPSSKSPHPWRRGVITRLLRDAGAPTEVVTGRCDVTARVIEQHYDRRTEGEKMEARRSWVERLG